MAAKAAVRNVARVTGDEKYGDPSAFISIGDEISKSIPSTSSIKLSDVEKDLREKFKSNKDALQIIEDAKLVEGAFIQYGMNAADVIVLNYSETESMSKERFNEI